MSELHSGFILIFIFGTDFDDIPCQFVAEDGRVLRDVGMDALVFDTELGHLIGGHADAVADDLD